MSGEAIQMQQIGEADKPALPQSSYWGWAISRAWTHFTLTGLRSHHGPRPDGLEAFDVLGGWEGSDARRWNIR